MRSGQLGVQGHSKEKSLKLRCHGIALLLSLRYAIRRRSKMTASQNPEVTLETRAKARKPRPELRTGCPFCPDILSCFAQHPAYLVAANLT
jgi:hypothetical protein